MKYILQIVIYFTIINILAQKPFTNEVITPLLKNQLYFEKVFIHTNKTSYFADDNIWFKAYIVDDNNNPSLNTRLLYVNLLDTDGKIIQNKTIFIDNGSGIGQFELNNSLQFGKYYIQAHTNFMRNFGEKNTFINQIYILNKKLEKKPKVKNLYDIQIFPEGGYLLEDTKNTVGIKSLVNGIGQDYSGYIINQKNEKVANFKNEHLGISKCDFFYRKKDKYTALINIRDTVLRIPVPIAKKKGIIFNINNTDKKIDLTLRTNYNSLAELNRNKYHLLFHQRNKIIDFMEISQFDSLNINFKIEKESFFNGVNTVTLFKNNAPFLQRKFYIEKQNKETIVSLKKGTIEKDSVNYILKTLTKHSAQPLKSNISISVLPKNTLNFYENTNIKSAFLLSPYIKGNIEKPAYYFNEKNLNRLEHLDLLLLTQGWTQYSVKEMVKKLNPNYKYNFEIGFKLKGKVSPIFSNNFALIDNQDRLINKIFLNSNKNFSFDKLHIYKGDTVRLAFLNNLNEAIKPQKIYFDSIKATKPLKFYPAKKSDFSKFELRNDNILMNFYNTELLDEVIVIGNKKKRDDIKTKELLKNFKNAGWYNRIELPEKNKHNNDLMNFLSYNQNVRLVNWKGLEYYLQYGSVGEAVLYIDGRQVRSEELLGVSLDMENVKYIMEKTLHFVKIIQVFTTDNYKNNIETLYKEYIFKFGYDKAKKYYTPKYNFNQTISNKKIEIDWKPELITNNLGVVKFKIKKYKNYIFFIQGFAENSYLISNIMEEE